jgi:myo-inositol-1(or 4)-monophosphatase
MPPSVDTLPPLPELLEAVREITRRAGDLALGALAQIEGELKEDMTFVTAADRQTEQFLRRELREIAPHVGFWGEEFGRHGHEDLTWIVDPIDGTNNLVYGVPIWGVSVGLAHRGESILGVFHLPLIRETFYAYQGGGAYLNGAKISVRKRTPHHHQDCLGITSYSARRLDFSDVTGYLRVLGSITTEVVYAACGRFYACVSYGDKLVDLGAAVCIAREAGCELTYLSGQPFHLKEWMEKPPPDEPMLIGPAWAIDEIRDTLVARPVQE